MLWTALPTLASTMLPRLYEVRSFVRAALTSMGSVLAAKSTVETVPARTATLPPSTTFRVSRAAGGYIGLNTHPVPGPEWVICRNTSPVGAGARFPRALFS